MHVVRYLELNDDLQAVHPHSPLPSVFLHLAHQILPSQGGGSVDRHGRVSPREDPEFLSDRSHRSSPSFPSLPPSASHRFMINRFAVGTNKDHGKSTLSDRLLELTGTIKVGEPGGNQQGVYVYGFLYLIG